MAGEPKLVIAGSTEEAQKAIAQLERKFENLENKLKHTNRLSKEGSTANPFSGISDGATTALARIGLVATALTAIVKTYEDIKERGQKAFETQKGLAGSLEGMAINIDVPLAEAEAEARRISKKTGVELGRVMASIGTAFSAKGQLGKADAFGAVEATAELIPNLPDAQDLLAGATLDLRKFDPKLTSKQSQGFLMRAMVQARVTELRSMAEHGAPAITGMAMLDRENPQALTEAAGIYGAITQGMRDPHGRKSLTAGTALLIQAREFLGDEAAKMTNEQVLETIARDRGAFTAFFEGGDHKGKKRKGLQMTITGPGGEEMSVSADRASFERQAVPVLKSMLTPGTQEYANWKTATKGMGDIGNTEQDWLAKKAELDASGIKQVIDLSNKIDADTQSQRSQDLTGATWASIYSKVDENLQSRGMWYGNRVGVDAELRFQQFRGKSPVAAAESVLGVRAAGYEQAAESYEQAQRSYPDSKSGDYWRQMAEDNRKAAESLREVVTLLKEGNADQKAKPIHRNGQVE